MQTQFWKPSSPNDLAGAELCDFNGDYVADLLRIVRGTTNLVTLLPGKLEPPSTAFVDRTDGHEGAATNAPAARPAGFGAALTVRAGLREQSRVVTGQSGGFNQSELPIVVGLGGVRHADYVHILWPDGVAQVEMQLASSQAHKIGELQAQNFQFARFCFPGMGRASSA